MQQLIRPNICSVDLVGYDVDLIRLCVLVQCRRFDPATEHLSFDLLALDIKARSILLRSLPPNPSFFRASLTY
jgi:hypothetical protein